jgi:hypothetical protein
MKRTTLTLVILALGLSGFVYFDEIRRKNKPEIVAQNHLSQINKLNQPNQGSQTNKQEIFSFDADDIQSLSIKTNEYSLNLERSQKLEPPNPQWLIKSVNSKSESSKSESSKSESSKSESPESDIPKPAKNAIVSYLTDLLVKGKSENSVSVKSNQLSEFGLDKPQATIDIKLKNQQSHRLILGKPNFNNTFLYAQAIPQSSNDGNVQVLLVSKDFANAVNRDLGEWQEQNDQKLGEAKSQKSEQNSSQDSNQQTNQQTNQNTPSQLLPGLPTANPADTK